MSKSKLQQAINAVNERYASGRNDDDQVARMVAIDKVTKGWSFMPRYDDYILVSDFEKLKSFASKYGYWSDEVKRLNDILISKGTILYADKLNDQFLAYEKQLARDSANN